MRYSTALAFAFSFMLASGCASTSSSDPAATTPAASDKTCAACAAKEGGEACATCAAGLECAECAGEKDKKACASCAAGETCADCAAKKKKDKASDAAGNDSDAGATSGATSGGGGEATATISAKGMGCPLCASSADRRLMKVDGVTWTNIDLGNGLVTVGLDPEKPTPAAEDLQKAIRDAGFTAEKVTLPEGEVVK